MANDHIQIPKGIRKKLESAIENNKNIINLAKEEYRYFRYNEGKARRQLLYILPLIIAGNIDSIYTCYKNYGKIRYIYKSLYLSLLLGIVSLVLYLTPIVQRLSTIVKLYRNNALIKKSLNKNKLTKAELNKLVETVNTIEKYNKRLSKDYSDLLERLPNNTIRKITTLRMISDLNKSIRKFIKRAMSALRSEQRLDDSLEMMANRIKGNDKVKGIKDNAVGVKRGGIFQRIIGAIKGGGRLRGLKESGNKGAKDKKGIFDKIGNALRGGKKARTRDKIAAMRSTRMNRLRTIDNLSKRSKSLGSKIKIKEKETRERDNNIRRKLGEIDEFKRNPERIDYLMDKVKNMPGREFNFKVGENLKGANIGSQMKGQIWGQATGQAANISNNKQSQTKSQEKQNSANKTTGVNFGTPTGLLANMRNNRRLFNAVINTIEKIIKKDINGDGTIGGEPTKDKNPTSDDKNKQQAKPQEQQEHNSANKAKAADDLGNTFKGLFEKMAEGMANVGEAMKNNANGSEKTTEAPKAEQKPTDKTAEPDSDMWKPMKDNIDILLGSADKTSENNKEKSTEKQNPTVDDKQSQAKSQEQQKQNPGANKAAAGSDSDAPFSGVFKDASKKASDTIKKEEVKMKESMAKEKSANKAPGNERQKGMDNK